MARGGSLREELVFASRDAGEYLRRPRFSASSPPLGISGEMLWNSSFKFCPNEKEFSKARAIHVNIGACCRAMMNAKCALHGYASRGMDGRGEETRILGGFLVDARNCFAGGRGISFFPIFFRLGWRNIVFKRNCGWVINYWDVDLKLGGYGVRFSVRNLWYFISWKFYEVKCVKRKEHLSNIMYIMFKSSNRNYLK